MAQLHLTFTCRWWWPWFLRLVILYAWCIYRFASEEYLDELVTRAGAFGARHAFKIGTH